VCLVENRPAKSVSAVNRVLFDCDSWESNCLLVICVVLLYLYGPTNCGACLLTGVPNSLFTHTSKDVGV
jgi:hypothetical protein